MVDGWPSPEGAHTLQVNEEPVGTSERRVADDSRAFTDSVKLWFNMFWPWLCHWAKR